MISSNVQNEIILKKKKKKITKSKLILKNILEFKVLKNGVYGIINETPNKKVLIRGNIF